MFAFISALLAFACPPPAAAQDITSAYTTMPGSTITHAAGARAADATMATDFCSGGELTGTIDATTCLQRAVDTMCNNLTGTNYRANNGGGQLYLPAGTYLVGSLAGSPTLTIGCSGLQVVGAGPGDRDQSNGRGTMIVAAGTSSAPVIQANVTKYAGQPSTTGFSYGFTIRDLQIYSGAGATGYRVGPFLEIDHFEHANVENVVFYAPCTAIKVYGGVEVHVTQVRALGTKDGCDAIYLTGDAAQIYNKLDVVSFDRLTVSTGTNGNCYRIKDRVQTVWWRNTTCETGGHAITADCPTMTSAANCPGFFTLYDFEAELSGPSSGGDMIALVDVVDGFKMTDSWLRGKFGANSVNNLVSSTKSRFPAAGNLMVNISNSWLKYAGGSCVYVTADQMSVTGSQIYGCNAYGVGAVGVQANSKRVTVTGNTFCGDDWLGDVTWPMAAGGYILAGVNYTTWTGNVFSPATGGHTNGCQSTVINNGGTLNNSIIGNVGP